MLITYLCQWIMTVALIAILVLAFVLMGMSNTTHVNKAAIAMFAGAVGWVLYICYGADFVLRSHSGDFVAYLDGAAATSTTVKHYIARNIFIRYVGKAAEIVLFLIATMSIVEILDQNGCFDFIKEALRLYESRKLLWLMTAITFVISANLDNLTTTTMMLVIMHGIVPQRRQRIIFGCAIVVAANCGGALTVIGDPLGLLLWTNGTVRAADLSRALALPCIVACVLPVMWLGRQLPRHIRLQWAPLPFRGDDTRLTRWQRLLMLVVGIGGLWFIPTFQNITKLSPFLGALCVLAVLWVVNEMVNSRLADAGTPIGGGRRTTIRQLGTVNLMLLIMGLMLAVGAVKETGVLTMAAQWIDSRLEPTIGMTTGTQGTPETMVWGLGALAAVMGALVDTFAAGLTFFSLYPTPTDIAITTGTAVGDQTGLFAMNGLYWKLVAYCSAMGGNMLLVGSASGLALMRAERVHIGWYFRNVGWVAMAGCAVGMALLWVTNG